MDLQAIAAMIEAQNRSIEQMVKDSEARINTKIENEVPRKIEALFDGYKLTHDKQGELERRLEELEKRLEEISTLLQAK
ncbi:MAG: hypothetical protein Q4E65_06815 [Clostridia bacterium]|nr:hypothetical protein [Clostridia bacterium]